MSTTQDNVTSIDEFREGLRDQHEAMRFVHRATRAAKLVARRFTPVKAGARGEDARLGQLRVLARADVPVRRPPPMVWAAQTGWTRPNPVGAVSRSFSRRVRRTAWVAAPGGFRVAQLDARIA